MNERIRELAEQAEKYADDNFKGEATYSEAYDNKFAELIVGACADLCDRFQARDVGMQPAECAGAIRKMFGVEE